MAGSAAGGAPKVEIRASKQTLFLSTVFTFVILFQLINKQESFLAAGRAMKSPLAIAISIAVSAFVILLACTAVYYDIWRALLVAKGRPSITLDWTGIDVATFPAGTIRIPWAEIDRMVLMNGRWRIVLAGTFQPPGSVRFQQKMFGALRISGKTTLTVQPFDMAPEAFVKLIRSTFPKGASLVANF